MFERGLTEVANQPKHAVARVPTSMAHAVHPDRPADTHFDVSWRKDSVGKRNDIVLTYSGIIAPAERRR